jgi:transcriptional regulator with XRE-family HTH domain
MAGVRVQVDRMQDIDPILTDEALGQRVHLLRKNRKLTQEQLARRAGLSPDTIRRMEHGEFSPSFDTMIKTALGLDIPLIALFCDTYDEPDDLANIARGLPGVYRRLAMIVLVTLYVDAVEGKKAIELTTTRKPAKPSEPAAGV